MSIDAIERQHGYRALFQTALDMEELHRIRSAASFSMPLGENRFAEQIESALNRSIGYAQRGRPNKHRLNIHR